MTSGEGDRHPPGWRPIYFCVPELVCGFDFIELLAEPVVDLSDPEVFPLFASKTDIPRGPMVISTGSPSFDLA